MIVKREGHKRWYVEDDLHKNTHFLKKELMIVDDPNGGLDVTSIVYDPKEERKYPPNKDTYGTNFILTKPEILQLADMIDDWRKRRRIPSKDAAIVRDKLNAEIKHYREEVKRLKKRNSIFYKKLMDNGIQPLALLEEENKNDQEEV